MAYEAGLVLRSSSSFLFKKDSDKKSPDWVLQTYDEPRLSFYGIFFKKYFDTKVKREKWGEVGLWSRFYLMINIISSL